MMDDMEDDDGTGRDPLIERVAALKGCSVLVTWGSATSRRFACTICEIFPVKSERVREIDDVIVQLQRLMNGSPPLWMRRVMRGPDGQRLPLDEQEI